MKTLDLVLKHKWYDMIDSGEKREEYREIKQCWLKRFCVSRAGQEPTDYDGEPIDCYASDSLNLCPICVETNWGGIDGLKDAYNNDWIDDCVYSHVKFHRGYTSTTMAFEIESITIGKGHEEWGAEPGKDYFVIKLGKRLKETES